MGISNIFLKFQKSIFSSIFSRKWSISRGIFLCAFILSQLLFGFPNFWQPGWSIPEAFAATQTYTSSSGNWTSPITGNVTVELWGAGGAGGKGGGANKNGGGGGAGGQYATKVVAVTKGNSYAYAVGSAGAATAGDGGSGGDTTFDSTTVVAKGGAGGKSYANGFAGGTGSTSGGVGDTVYAGGNGAAGASTRSGGGGGGAGSTGTGNNGSTSTGGTAKSTNGGAGGDGSTANSGAGSNGSNYAGAGGGATRNGTPGDGAPGYVVLTYADNAAPSVSLNTANAYDFSSDTTPTVEFTGTDAGYLDDITYNIQIDDDSGFGSPSLDKVSGTDSGFVNTVSGGDTNPFNSGEKVSFTVQAGDALAGGTYYWRVRGKDPSGTDTYGSWTSGRSFTITFTPVISVSISDGTVSYGGVAVNATQDTTSSGANDSQTATNDGNIAEDFNIKGQDSANWTLQASNGLDEYRHRFCTITCDSSPTWTALTTSYQALAANVAPVATQTFDLEIQTPTSSSSFLSQNVDVTVQAVQH